ncbi:MAG: hypothetical protein AAB354_08100 [candidate division KSB1 bacterium]
MKNKTLLQWVTAGAIVSAFWQVGAQTEALAGEKITLRLAYTSDSNGYIDACG